MELSEEEFAAAEKQLTALEEKLNAAEGGLSNIHGILTDAETKLTALGSLSPPISNKSESGSVVETTGGSDSKPNLENENLNNSAIDEDENDEAVIIRDVTNAIKEQLSPQELTVKAEVGCGGSAKLEIFIVSSSFEGQALLKRHKAVQSAVRTISNYDSRIHAITITKSLTPSQYETHQQNLQKSA